MARNGRFRAWPLLGVMVASLLTSPPAYAQSGAASYLRSVIRAGDVIWITGPDGRDLKGIVESISETALDMRMAGSVVPYRLTDVRMIEKPDSIRDGLLIGALIGVVLGSIPAWDVDRARSSALVSTVLLGGIGAAAGAYGDSLREGRTIIYRSTITLRYSF